MMIKKLFKTVVIVLLIAGVLLAAAIFWVTQPTWQDSSNASYQSLADSGHLKEHVKVLSEDYRRDSGNSYYLTQVRDYIFEQLSQNLGNVRIQSYVTESGTFHNVVARIDGEKDCPLIVVGAHYDTFRDYPGADDNASGVAAIIELSRMFSEQGGDKNSSKMSPKCPVELVAYANEEPPFFRTKGMGSYVHAESLSRSNTDIRMMISLETIGYFSDEPNSQQYPVDELKYIYSDVGNFITIVGDLSQVGVVRDLKSGMQSFMTTEVYSINAPVKLAGIDFSDHRSYWEFGYPAVMVTDTAFNRNLNYHTREDTYEKLDYQRMADVVNGVFHAVMTLD